MKAAAIFPGARRVELLDLPEPLSPGPHEVLLRVLDVGICGTDREICSYEYGTPPSEAEYLVLGHEALAEVVESGSDVDGLRPGDLVVPTVRRPCPHDHCPACRAGRQDFCYTGQYRERGIRGAHGFMAEYVTEEAANLVPLDRGLRGVGVLVEPLTIAEKAMLQVWDIQERLPWRIPGGNGKSPRALVLGGGPVGLLGAMKLLAGGFHTTVYSRERADSEKAALVRRIGGRYVSAADAAVQDLGPADLIYEAAGASALAFQALPALDVNGIFLFTGVPGRRGPIGFDGDAAMRDLVLKNQVFLGTVNAGRPAFDAAVRDLAEFHRRWPRELESLITRRFLLDEFVEPLERGGGIKNVVAVGGAA